ncbi:MAG: sodium:proton antiporter [Pseudomonadota bacterium]
MSPDLVLTVALVGIAGIGAQWLAWRFNAPGIVLLSLAGITLGPLLGIVTPRETFGDIYDPLISLAVGIILFEGGLQLKFNEVTELGRGVRRLVVPGALIAWALGTGAAHLVAGLSLPTALLFGGIMVVTGPTVIGPLLRQAKLSSRPATLLRWEGIVNDPLGALLAVIVYEAYHLSQPGPDALALYQIGGSLAIGVIISVALGLGLGLFIARAFQKGWVPEYLKTPILLVAVILCFALANGFQEEAGLLAVTVMGITLANAKLPSINQLLHFKENIAVLFVSGVFILLTASLSPDVLFDIGWRDIAFVVVMLIVVRPLTIFLSLIGTEVTWSERSLVAWIAPRGIVAVAVSGLFAQKMVELGYADGAKMVPLAFAMVFTTVVAHGFSIAPLGRFLGLAQKGKPGVLIVGASPWAAALGARLRDLGVPVLITDPNYRALRTARQEGLPSFYGEILSEVAEHHIELNHYGTLLAVTGSDSHNALVCTDLAFEFDRARTFQLSAHGVEGHRRTVSYALKGRPLFSRPMALEDLIGLHHTGWGFQMTRISEEYPPERFAVDMSTEALIVLIERDDQLLFDSSAAPIEPRLGDRVLCYVPPSVSAARIEKQRVEKAATAAQV